MTDTPVQTPEAVETIQQTPDEKKRRWPIWLGAALIALLAWNAIVFVPVFRALSDESEATTVAYRRWLVSPTQIVFDVWSVEGTQSMAGMDRHLLKAAEALKGQSFDNVVLAYRGKAKLTMDGPYFQEIGETRQTQNPVYTMRTMQEKMTNLDGTPAFDTWSGGLLGVLGKQLEDHNEFHARWWLRDVAGVPEGTSMGSQGSLP